MPSSFSLSFLHFFYRDTCVSCLQLSDLIAHASRHSLAGITADAQTGEDGTLNADDILEYSLTVTNTGSTCLMDVDISDTELATIDCDVRYEGQSVDCDSSDHTSKPLLKLFLVN